MIALLVKATLLLVVGLLAVRVAARTRASVRHAILVAIFAVLLALPVAAFTLPAFELAVLPPPTFTSASNTSGESNLEPPPADTRPGLQQGEGVRTASEAAKDSAWNWSSWLLGAWAAGAILMLGWLGLGMYRVHHLRRTALPCLATRPLSTALADAAGVRAQVEVVTHEALSAPITCGLWRQSILLPVDVRDWSDADLSCALVHELEHVKRRDWTTQVIARAVCALYWCHPLVWMAYRRLCLEAEHACDDAVVAREEHTKYAEQLVSLARRMAAAPAAAVLGMAHRSDLATRVAAVLDATKARGRVGALRASAVALAAVAALTATAPLHVVAAARPSASPPGAPVARRPSEQPRVARLDRVLVEAADEGDLQDVRELLENGADVNARVDGDGSPLIVAAREGHIDIVRLLLDRGADVDMPVAGDGAPLLMAAREGHLGIVQLLLDRGANVELVVPGDENALIQAAGAGHLAVVQLLVARGANVNARVFADEAYQRREGEWRTPLGMARRGGHREVEAFLRAAGAVE